jgi:hypothetical protein
MWWIEAKLEAKNVTGYECHRTQACGRNQNQTPNKANMLWRQGIYGKI